MELPPSLEMYLRIKPTSAVTKEEKNIYKILHSSTLLMKLPSFESNVRNSSRKSSETSDRRHDFTKIFGSETSQADMFERSIKHRVTEFLDGESSTIMTYGTRDSGKTYTLFGTSTSPGIIMRSIQLVFSKKRCCRLRPQVKPKRFHQNEMKRFLEDTGARLTLSARSRNIIQQMSTEEATRFLENSRAENHEGCLVNDWSLSDTLWLSFVEIYNGNVYDLLEEKGCSLRLVTNKKGQTYVRSSQVRVRTALEACKIFLTGQSRMRTIATPSNPRRSWSHTIFKMHLLSCENYKSIYSTLTFCDLAGSTQFETHQKKSDMREANFINNSLLVLGRCLKAVSENQVAPFRESKLTRIFQPALSGKENLSFIVNVAFTPNFYIETQYIFNFCDVAKKLIDTYTKYKNSYECKVTSSKACDNNVILLPYNRPTLSATAEKTDCIDSKAYKDIQEQNKKLMKELETTKSDILNREYAIRKELADHYSRMIEEMEATYKKHTKEIETERYDLLKWSVKQVENFYKERIDNLMRHKKRKREDSGDYIKDSHALYEELETENAQVTSKMMVLKETMKKLRDENETILCKKNRCSFELALITKELNKFRQLTRPRIRKWDSNTENDPDHLVNNLEHLMYEEIKMTETKLKEINEYICATKDEDIEAASEAVIVNQKLSKSEDLLNDTLSKMKELEEELSRKEVYIVDIKDDNMKNQKCDRSTNISFHDYAVDSFFEHGNVLISSAEKNSLQVPHMNSPTADERNFDDWIVVPKLFATSTRAGSAGKKSSNISDTDRGSLFENSGSMDCSVSRSSDRSNKDDSGVSSELQNGSRKFISVCDSTYTRENEDRYTQTCLIEENIVAIERSTDSKKQNHEETLHVTELSENLETIRDVIHALNEAACVNERKIIQSECQFLYEEEIQKRSIEGKRKIAIKRDALSKMIEDKMQEYKREIRELTHKLIVKEENEDRTSKCLERYIERSKSLEKKLSSMSNQLNKASDKCANEHLPRIESLEDEVLRKTLQINELDGKIVQMQHKFAKGYELFEKIHDFETIMKRCQRDKNELCRQLYECLETQLTLEDKLKELTMKIEERESEVISLKSEICNITDLNRSNNEKAKNLSKQVIEASESIDSAKEDLQCCTELRKNVENVIKTQINFKSRLSDYKNNSAFQNRIYDDSQDEIIRLKMQLEHKELEISLFKNSIDAITQKYEILVKHLQNEIKEKDKQFKTVPNNLNNLEKSFTKNSVLSEIIDSLHEFKSTEDQDMSEQSIESLKVDEADCSLTDSICLVPKHVNSKVLDVSSVLSEDSTTSFNEKDGDSIKFESYQIDSSVRSDVHLFEYEADSSETEVNFNMRSPSTKDKKKVLDWMKVRKIHGKTALRDSTV
ncbi:unnamed protein product [Lasius platythorax]|uniref:Kinesin motor domain-containing protein n=2 Tax=Lasius platythorax TaxID=488582 RepID=A0AAV2N8B7_9HYME